MGLFIKIARWYRKTFWSLEKQAIHAGVKLGRNNRIRSRFWGSEPYLITIGDNCGFAGGSVIYTHGGGLVVRNKDSSFDVFGKVVLGNWVYVGAGAQIMPGVVIGDNVLIAAGSVVTRSVPSGVVVAGNPAKYICTVDEYIEKNSKYNVSSYGMSAEEKKAYLLSLDDSKFIKKGNLKI